MGKWIWLPNLSVGTAVRHPPHMGWYRVSLVWGRVLLGGAKKTKRFFKQQIKKNACCTRHINSLHAYFV
jgi:hypothetical protein